MATCVLLTRLAPEAVTSPKGLEELAQWVIEKLRTWPATPWERFRKIIPATGLSLDEGE